MESWPTLAHPLANKVGWFNLNNINCGLLGMPSASWSSMSSANSPRLRRAQMQAFVDEIRKPRAGLRCPLCANSGHHSITSSARASTDGGTVSPSALAVLRLMTVSNLVGAGTGRSAGFSPLRMRAA